MMHSLIYYALQNLKFTMFTLTNKFKIMHSLIYYINHTNNMTLLRLKLGLQKIVSLSTLLSLHEPFQVSSFPMITRI